MLRTDNAEHKLNGMGEGVSINIDEVLSDLMFFYHQIALNQCETNNDPRSRPT